MYVEVDLAAHPRPALLLRDRDDFAKFRVVICGGDTSDARFRTAIAELGEFDGTDHAWLSIDAVLSLAGDRRDCADWNASFSEMVEFAAQHGFVDVSHGRLRAHCELAR